MTLGMIIWLGLIVLEPLGGMPSGSSLMCQVRLMGTGRQLHVGSNEPLQTRSWGGTKGQSWGPGYQVVDTRAFNLKRRCDALIRAQPLPPIPHIPQPTSVWGGFYIFGEKETEGYRKSKWLCGWPQAAALTLRQPPEPRQLPALSMVLSGKFICPR